MSIGPKFDSNYLALPSEIPEYSFFRVEKSINELNTSSNKELNLSLAEHLLNIKDQLNWIFINTITGLYRGFNSTESLEGKLIAVCGHVEKDGLGDYYHLRLAAEVARKNFPQCPVVIIADVVNLKDRVKYLDIPKDCTIHFIDTKMEEDATSIKNAIEALAKASVIIDAPYGNFALLGDTKPFLQKCKDEVTFIEPNPNQILKFQELDEEPGLLDEETWSLGFIDFHMGVFIVDSRENQSLLDIQDSVLKEFLFGTKNATQEMVLEYQASHHYRYGYIKSTDADYITAQAFLASFVVQNAKSKKQILDIILPSNNLQMSDDITKLLAKHNVATIQLCKKVDGKIVVVEEKKLAKEGSVLRIINPFPLLNEDCKLFANVFEQPSGCTGDISLMESEFPFYQVAPHKVLILPSMIHLVRNELNSGKDSVLVKYFEKLNEISEILHGKEESTSSSSEDDELDEEESTHTDKKLRIDEPKSEINANMNVSEKKSELSKDERIANVAEEIGILLQDPNLLVEMAAFRNLIKKRYNFNEVLRDLVERSFARMAVPNLAMLEDSIKAAFIAQKATLDNGYLTFKKIISEFKNKQNVNTKS